MKSIRKSILLAVVILLALGTVMIYSSSGVYAFEKYGSSTFFLYRHLRYLLIGIVLFFFALSIDIGFLKRYAKHLLVIALGLLILVFLPGVGRQAGGALRWVSVFGMQFQPAEAVKVILIIFFADFIDRKNSKINNIPAVLLPATCILLLFGGLILIQPDFGMFLMIVAIITAMFIVGGINLHYFLYAALGTLPIIYFLISQSAYRRRRIMAFVNPWLDARGSGFQAIQSFLALGSGGITGVGLGRSTQKLYFLPESHTDFIFSIIGEEIGFFGCLAVVLLFFLIMVQGIRAAAACENMYRKLLAFGLIIMIVIEAIINISVGVGLFPTKGLPLPFVSYGGTHLVTHLFALGLFFNATKERRVTGTHIRAKVQWPGGKS